MSNPDNGDIFLGTGNLDISSRPNEVKLSRGELSFYEQRILPPQTKNPKRAVDLHVSPSHPIPGVSYAPAARFSLIPSGLENPGPTVVPVTVYPSARPAPEAAKTTNAAANVEVNEVNRGILFGWPR